MVDFFYENGGTILVSVFLLLVVIYNVKKLCKEKNICGCSCSNCLFGSCRNNDTKN